MTAEERAKDVTALLMKTLPGCSISLVMADRDEAFNLIASAIRQAEIDALERAALLCDEEAKTSNSAVFADRAFGRREAGRRLGRFIRSLCHNQTAG